MDQFCTDGGEHFMYAISKCMVLQSQCGEIAASVGKLGSTSATKKLNMMNTYTNIPKRLSA